MYINIYRCVFVCVLELKSFQQKGAKPGSLCRTEKERLWRKMKSLLESLEVWSGLLGRSKNLLHGLLEELQSYLHSNEQNLPPKLEKLFRIAESEQTLHCIRMWSRAIVEGAVSATSCSSLPEGSAKLAGSSSEASESGSLLRIGNWIGYGVKVQYKARPRRRGKIKGKTERKAATGF